MRAEALAAAGRTSEAIHALRFLSIRDFGEVLLEVPDRFPALAAALPVMPTAAIQQDWTGRSGRTLLRQTVAFVRTMESAFVRLCNRPLEGATILDYGCGWGRILRLMYRYSDPSRVYGVDAWEESLAVCRATRLLGHLARCDDVPRMLPFGDVAFDLVYAFSVFTHLSEKTAHAAMDAIRGRIRDNGLMVLTIRSSGYWSRHRSYPAGIDAGAMSAAHREKGFAFLPHLREPIDGDVTFGETSIALDYIRRHWTGWRLAGHQTNWVDRYQVVVFLRPE